MERSILIFERISALVLLLTVLLVSSVFQIDDGALLNEL
jgi:hypothetical protein